MEYQGFTGNNYDEDDRERAKFGGSIGGFGRNTLPPGYAEAMSEGERQQSRSIDELPFSKNLAGQPKQIETMDVQQPEDENTKKYKDIQDTQDRLNNRQIVLNAMLQGGIFGTEDEDFKKLKEEQDLDIQKIAFNPLNDEYIQMQEAKELQDAINSLNKSREPGKFLKIGDIIKPQWTK